MRRAGDVEERESNFTSLRCTDLKEWLTVISPHSENKQGATICSDEPEMVMLVMQVVVVLYGNGMSGL